MSGGDLFWLAPLLPFMVFLLLATGITLVRAADLITFFMAWKLVGLCSYLLIGFWFEQANAPPAATKALLTTRLTDLAMLAGILLLVGAVGSADIATLLNAGTEHRIAPQPLFAITLLLFIGAAGKSAQVPFQGWLPDAVVGPTPVSVLLHSATMVAVGVFLLARLYLLFQGADPVLSVVAWIGGLTALLGAAAALVQTDLKRPRLCDHEPARTDVRRPRRGQPARRGVAADSASALQVGVAESPLSRYG